MYRALMPGAGSLQRTPERKTFVWFGSWPGTLLLSLPAYRFHDTRPPADDGTSNTKRDEGIMDCAKRYTFSAKEMTRILDDTIDRFMEYQYGKGYDEPRARAEAVMDVIERLAESGSGFPGDDIS